MSKRTERVSSSILGSVGGFTLVEMMVVVVIIGILATIFITQFGSQTIIARQNATRATITQVEGALDTFHLANGHYPDRLEDLVNRPSDAKNWPKGGYLKTIPRDAWGNDFHYTPRSSNADVLYEIISYGADNRVGGSAEEGRGDEDIYNSDKLKK